MTPIPLHYRHAALLALTLAATATAAPLPAGAAAPLPVSAAAGPPAAAPAFAQVGATAISHDEFNAAFSAAARAKFYHGKPPPQELALLQRDVSDQLVNRVLLLDEAARRGLRPDAAAVQQTVQTYEQRYAASADWAARRAQVLPALVRRLEQDSLLAQVEQAVRAGATADEAAVKAYYLAHPDKFTEPEQLRVAVILLKVDPAAPTTSWIEVDQQAQALAQRARAGEDFGALARAHSADSSAAQGGDMGYLHLGMLPDGTQQALSALAVGGTTDTLRLLQGMAVFRLLDRKQSRLLALDAVRPRARELALRERGERAWSGLLATLRAATPVTIDRSRLLPLDAQARRE